VILIVFGRGGFLPSLVAGVTSLATTRLLII
jgi:hypothetical protein